MSESTKLEQIQRDMASVVMSPLTDWSTSKYTNSGELSSVIAERIIASNDRLSSLERLEIYNKQYWYRLVDSMYEDFKGVYSLLGKSEFNKIIFEYLTLYPSKNFTLRMLGSKFVEFLNNRAELLGEKSSVVIDMATLEWANIKAFDSAVLAKLTPELLAQTNPGNLVLRLQPHISVLSFSYPVDEAFRGIKSKSIDEITAPQALPSAEKVWVVVHRQENSIFYKRIEESAYILLIALQKGFDLQSACEEALPYFEDQNELLPKIQAWFQTWSMLGWFSMEKAVEELHHE